MYWIVYGISISISKELCQLQVQTTERFRRYIIAHSSATPHSNLESCGDFHKIETSKQKMRVMSRLINIAENQGR